MAVSVEDVKKLRAQTGAGIMDCKVALHEAQGDFQEAVAVLRKQGIEVAAKRESKAAQEGMAAAYVHAGDQIGVLVEVNCETDFVARTEQFKHFGTNVAMQIAALRPSWVAPEDVPEEALARERDILTEQALTEGKPEHIVEKIVEGRLKKFYAQCCLLAQPYIRDDSITVQDLLDGLTAQCGEKIVVRRFTRYQVGEELS